MCASTIYCRRSSIKVSAALPICTESSSSRPEGSRDSREERCPRHSASHRTDGATPGIRAVCLACCRLPHSRCAPAGSPTAPASALVAAGIAVPRTWCPPWPQFGNARMVQLVGGAGRQCPPEPHRPRSASRHESKAQDSHVAYPPHRFPRSHHPVSKPTPTAATVSDVSSCSCHCPRGLAGRRSGAGDWGRRR